MNKLSMELIELLNQLKDNKENCFISRENKGANIAYNIGKIINVTSIENKITIEYDGIFGSNKEAYAGKITINEEIKEINQRIKKAEGLYSESKIVEVILKGDNNVFEIEYGY